MKNKFNESIDGHDPVLDDYECIIHGSGSGISTEKTVEEGMGG